jgi:hypothetical protein
MDRRVFLKKLSLATAVCVTQPAELLTASMPDKPKIGRQPMLITAVGHHGYGKTFTTSHEFQSLAAAKK